MYNGVLVLLPAEHHRQIVLFERMVNGLSLTDPHDDELQLAPDGSLAWNSYALDEDYKMAYVEKYESMFMAGTKVITTLFDATATIAQIYA